MAFVFGCVFRLASAVACLLVARCALLVCRAPRLGVFAAAASARANRTPTSDARRKRDARVTEWPNSKRAHRSLARPRTHARTHTETHSGVRALLRPYARGRSAQRAQRTTLRAAQPNAAEPSAAIDHKRASFAVAAAPKPAAAAAALSLTGRARCGRRSLARGRGARPNRADSIRSDPAAAAAASLAESCRRLRCTC